ncbi:MAG TPA: hypothetical protein VFB38_26870 [Chthonomonadaceae bacterium]|nr:hypothetical protein [Chthonomonadaceae bacterium]
MLSPDGKKLIWIGRRYHVLALDGSHEQTFPHSTAQVINGLLPFIPSVAWLSDSSAWVEIQGPSRASSLVVHSLEDTPPVSVPLPAAVGTQKIVGVTPRTR